MHTLITELERVSTGSRELDGRIALELGWRKGLGKGYERWIAPESEPEIVDSGNGHRHLLGRDHVPFFTEGMDDAETVVPPNCGWHLESDGSASVHSLKQEPEQIGFLVMGIAKGATPPLGLVIAALKAREKEQADG